MKYQISPNRIIDLADITDATIAGDRRDKPVVDIITRNGREYSVTGKPASQLWHALTVAALHESPRLTAEELTTI